MKVSIYLLVAGFIFLDAIIFTEGQDCGDYVLIADPRRTTQQVFNGITDSPISDKDLNQNLTKWYRFQSYVGNKIPERPVGESVDMNRCGTTYPMYISGVDQHPTHDLETVTATIETTAWARNISIHQCPPDVDNERFYIYRLVPAPADQTAYCAGEGVPCAEGLMHNGIECVDYFPVMSGTPVFSGPHTTGNNAMQQIYYKCQVQYNRVPDDSFARFMITFIFDGLELEDIATPHKRLPPFIVEPSDDISANLTEYYLQGRLGKDIQCKVRSFWEQNSEKGPSMMSLQKHKATLEAVEIFDFDFNKGTEQTIPFHSTVPFTFYHCSLHQCPLPFIYYFSLKTPVATDIDCTLRWINGTDLELVVYIKPFAGNRIFEAEFQPYDGDFFQQSSSLWHNFIIPTVTIRSFVSSDRWCKAMWDPHITTFDSKYFEAFFNGDYYLVLGEADPYKLEVQVRQETCNGNVACICGVIVREINSVLKVGYKDCGKWDKTTPRPISVTRLLRQYPDDGTEITIDDTGRKFSIRMPSGSRVEVDATVPYFCVQVNLAPMYHGKTSFNSMCGNSNDNPDDDSTDSDTAKILDPAKSYFNAQPDCNEDYFPKAVTCSCAPSTSGVECTDIEQNVAKKSPANKAISTMWSSGITCVDLKRSSLVQHSSDENNADYILDPADLFPPFVPDPNAGHNLTLTWPTPKNKTKQEVEQYCLNKLTGSPVYGDCNTVANTDLTILQCVSDIQIADEYIATTSYADTFGQECVNVLITQENENNSTGGGTPPAVDMSTIYSKICPAHCSGHGNCSNATCICNAGYIGADCSIDETKPPVLTGIARSGICDIQQRPCASVIVFGHGIISSETLKCQFLPMGTDSSLDTIGTFVTGSEISCAVPNTNTERTAISRQGISVSNEGAMFSNSMEFVTFDSVCMSCGQDQVCTQKTDSCLISDRCYANGATKDTQTCQQCSPSQSISSWTDMPVTDKLQPCSRTCDYGAQVKETVCTSTNTVVKTEPVLCQSSSCTAIPEETSHGVIMNISNKDATKILLTPADILSQVAQAVNNYCSAHATECCNSIGVPNGVSLSSFTSLELCPYGSGYPQVGDTSSRIKVIVKIIPSQVQNECVQGAPQNSPDGEQAYADPDIIVTAVTEGKDIIEKALSITIASVEKDTGSHSRAGLPVAKHTLILVTAVTAFALTRLM